MLVISLQTAGGCEASGGSLRRSVCFLKKMPGSVRHVEAVEQIEQENQLFLYFSIFTRLFHLLAR